MEISYRRHTIDDMAPLIGHWSSSSDSRMQAFAWAASLLRPLNSATAGSGILTQISGVSHETCPFVRRVRLPLPRTPSSAEATILLGLRVPAGASTAMAEAASPDGHRLPGQPGTSSGEVDTAPPRLLAQLSHKPSGLCRAQSALAAGKKRSTTSDCKDVRVSSENASAFRHLCAPTRVRRRDCKDGRLEGPDRSTAATARTIES